MNKNITLSILTSSILFLAGCGSDSTASLSQENKVVEQSSTQLETRHTGAINNVPVACAKTFFTTKDTNLTAQLVATDNDTLTYAISDLNISKGSIDLNTSSGLFDYAPAEGFVGTYTFNFTAIDEHDANDTAAITVVVQEPDMALQKPSAPTNLEVNSSTTTSINLTWTDTSNNESGFIIYQNGVAVKCIEENQQSVMISGLAEGQSYEFTIKAKNAAGCSDSSDPVIGTTAAATTAPAAPTNLTVVAQNKTCVKLNWEDNADNESGFRIYDQNGELKTVSANCKCTTISGLNAGEEYTFKVVAFNSVGESIASEVTVTTDPNVNSVPVAQSKTFSTYEDTNLTGRLCAYDADGDALTYAVVDSPPSGTIDVNASSGQFIYTPVTGFTGTDTFTFTASDDTNISEVKTITIKVCEVEGTKPAAPTELNVTVDATNFYLTWIDNSDNEDDFRIFRNGNYIATVGADETNATLPIGDLNMSAKYRFEVRAFNSYYCSDAAATGCQVWTQP